MRRRFVFATPFIVVVGCARSAKHEPRPLPSEAPSRPEPEPAPPPPPRPVPKELVETLAPLSPAKTFYEVCQRAHCNPPPPPSYVPESGPMEPTLVRVIAVQRERTGSRVRLVRKPSMNKNWRAVFVDRVHIDRPDGACEMTDWDYDQLECVTQLSPEDLIEDAETLRVRVIPPETRR